MLGLSPSSLRFTANAVPDGSRWSAQRQPPVCVESCDCTLKWVPESWFLSSLQDEFGSRSVTGGAPVGDHRLLSAILSGLIAGITTAHARGHDFALNRQPSACSLSQFAFLFFGLIWNAYRAGGAAYLRPSDSYAHADGWSDKRQ